jgi:mannose-6-phosphate isomerase-like protein (cupin superfamily)
MEIKNIYSLLSTVQIDKATGIKLVKMTGDPEISIYAAEISPNTELNPHYHKNGIETYQVLEGKGVMKVGDCHNDTFKWTEIFEVSTGDCYFIPANKVHQIINNSNEVLRTVFACPSDHLGTDRFFIK